MKQRIAPIIGTLLLVTGCVWWFATMHQVEELTYVGLKGAARDDPFLALKRLLRGAGLRLEEPAASAKPALKLDNLPPGGTVLLSDRRHLLMTPKRVQILVAWVEAGGHLIVEAEYPGRPDPLLAALGLARRDLVYSKPVAVTSPQTSEEGGEGETHANHDKAEKAMERDMTPAEEMEAVAGYLRAVGVNVDMQTIDPAEFVNKRKLLGFQNQIGFAATGSNIWSGYTIWNSALATRGMYESMKVNHVLDRKSTRLNSSHT